MCIRDSFIDTLEKKFCRREHIKIGAHKFRIKSVKKFKLSHGDYWYTATPVVLYRDNRKNLYFNFRKTPDIEFFVNRIRENAMKKYEIYHNKKISVPDPLFDFFEFKKTVAPVIKRGPQKFIFIGTVGLFKLPKIRSRRVREFYEFIMDCGLGEKNSMGFGFINPVSKDARRNYMEKNG